MTFAFGKKSSDILAKVDPKLAQLARRAIELSPVDFTITEGLRSVERQQQLVAQGASQTMKSKHIEGRAIDVAPLIDGKVSYNDWGPFYTIADAFAKAAKELKIDARWGGCWDVPLRDWKKSAVNESAGYVERKRAKKQKPFLDGPHYEVI